MPTSLDELAARFEADGARPVGLRRVFTVSDVLLTRVVVRAGHRLDAEAVRALISAELGPRLRVDLEQVAAIERLPSGKAPSSVGELTFPQSD